MSALLIARPRPTCCSCSCCSCCCYCVLALLSLLVLLQQIPAGPGLYCRASELQAQSRGRRSASAEQLELDAYDEQPEDELEEDDYSDVLNVTAEKSKYLGSPCDAICNPSLQHVHCHPQTRICECEKSYPVQLGPTKGCAKPKKLGEQCLYQATCVYTDQHSTCTQIKHNAVCECEVGYHRSAFSKYKKQFCAADLVLIATDLPTLLGVGAGIAVFTGLICFVLQLFSRARYTRPRNYANAGQAPMLFSSDTGIPLALQHHHQQQQQQQHHHGRPSSRSSQRSSSFAVGHYAATGSTTAMMTRKQSTVHQPLVPTSRAGAARAAAILLISCNQQGSSSSTSSAEPAQGGGDNGAGGNKHRRALSDVAECSSDGLGSRRPSVASIHSSTSSAKSYSARRFERERNDKEQRLMIAELKQQREQQREQQQQQQPAPTPSPRTPHSTDELLPSVEEATEILYAEQVPTTSGISNAAKSKTTSVATGEGAAKATSNSSTYAGYLS